ncbi:MAG: 4Fe-4S dicluster domain-containing protein [Candidatus Freyarchaeota archaeon]
MKPDGERVLLEKVDSVTIIGGGVAGIQAALELAELGVLVYLVDEKPSIGGRIIELNCSSCRLEVPMDCSICPVIPKMVECYHHPNIRLLTNSRVVGCSGEAGNFVLSILRKPRFVTEDKCSGCGACIQVCPVEVFDAFSMVQGRRRAIYFPMPQAFPQVPVIDKENCLHFRDGNCDRCSEVCPTGAIDFGDEEMKIGVESNAIILATGLVLYDPAAVREYGYKRYKNVVTILDLEQMTSIHGPTGGRIIRVSDGKEPKRIAFIQCVGSRSRRTGNNFCSGVCCMYTAKDAALVKVLNPETEVYVFYIDLRVFGKGYQELLDKVRNSLGVRYIRGRPGWIWEDPETKDLIIGFENTLAQRAEKLRVDMVVLSPALLPHPSNRELAEILGVELDEDGFFRSPNPVASPCDTTVEGIFTVGYCRGPRGVSESATQASAAAARVTEKISLTKERRT